MEEKKISTEYITLGQFLIKILNSKVNPFKN